MMVTCQDSKCDLNHNFVKGMLCKMSSLGERVKEVRKYYKLTQNEFAEKLGVSREYVSRLENGKENPSYNTLLSFDVFFNVSQDWLTTGNGKMFGNLDLEQTTIKIRERTVEAVIRAIKSGKDPAEEELIAEAFKTLASMFHILHTSNIIDGKAITLSILCNLHSIINTAASVNRNSNTNFISKSNYSIKESETQAIISEINCLFDIDSDLSDLELE